MTNVNNTNVLRKANIWLLVKDEIYAFVQLRVGQEDRNQFPLHLWAEKIKIFDDGLAVGWQWIDV